MPNNQRLCHATLQIHTISLKKNKRQLPSQVDSRIAAASTFIACCYTQKSSSRMDAVQIQRSP